MGVVFLVFYYILLYFILYCICRKVDYGRPCGAAGGMQAGDQRWKLHEAQKVSGQNR